VRAGVAPVFVVFNADGSALDVPGADEVIAVRPDPYNTRGEAAIAARLARERHWRSLVVVTSSYHVARARFIFGRAFEGELTMVPAPATTWRLPFDVASEAAKWVALGLRR
jgi:uncharacterized SAM-binding protein YcdF (DUF218 family)